MLFFSLKCAVHLDGTQKTHVLAVKCVHKEKEMHALVQEVVDVPLD